MRLQFLVEHRPRALQVQRDQKRKRIALFGIRSHHMAEPLVAPLEHLDQQLLQALGVVVEIAQRCFHAAALIATIFKQREGALRGRFVMRLRLVGHRRLRAEAGQQRHLPRQAGGERINRRDAQPRRVGKQIPPQLGIAYQRCQRQFARDLLVCRERIGDGLHCRRQVIENARAHFRRRLVGEGDGDDFFRLIDGRQQAQIALRQQLGLARSGRGFDDERCHLQRAPARSFIYCEQFTSGHGSLQNDARSVCILPERSSQACGAVRDASR